MRSQKEMSDVRSSYLYIKYPIGRTHLESLWLWLALPWHVYWSFWNINGPIDLKIRLSAHDRVVVHLWAYGSGNKALIIY